MLILALTAAIGGLSGQYTVRYIIESSLGYKSDDWTMLATVVTLIVALIAITSMQCSDNMMAPMFLSVGTLIVWILFFFVYLSGNPLILLIDF